MRAVTWLVDLVFPPRCPACAVRTAHVALCAACVGAIVAAGSPLCLICGECFAGAGPDHLCSRCARRPPYFHRARACAVYGRDRASPLIDALHRFKYERDVTLAPILGAYLSDRCPLPVDHDVIVPVPLDLTRLRWRGFNQAAMLAAALARRTGRPIAPRALTRCRLTAPQVGLGEEERRRNVADAFAVRDCRSIEDTRVLLVDDVMTTGTTVNECAKMLRRAGAIAVDVVVLARAADI